MMLVLIWRSRVDTLALLPLLITSLLFNHYCEGFAFINPLSSHEKISTANTNCHDSRQKKHLGFLYAKRDSSTSSSIPKDVVIIGGGLAGLSFALELANNHNRYVTVLEKNSFSSTGSFAAAGMLAPQSERLPKGPLLDLCLQSRDMYADFVQNVEILAKNSGAEGDVYLTNNKCDDDVLKPWEVGFQATGGFLAPAFAGDSVATWAPPEGTGLSYWLDEIQVRELEPLLHPDVIGGWWFPEDASVDARRLTNSLRAACVAAGVQILMGPETAAASLELAGGKCSSIHLEDGRTFSAETVVVANGSWMRELLPVPITPHKGQSFSLRMDMNRMNSSPLLSRVLFAQDTYIVPKADGRIVVGATVEPGSYDPNVTPAGMLHCMNNAISLLPALADLPLEETWAGLRPTTPDKAPILGGTSWDNLFIAGGYWRNGVLLAPKTAQLLADLVSDKLSEEDQLLLKEFSWERFLSPDGGAKLAADSRYASSMHPVHGRSSGIGISAAVGTELGFYSDARAASAERKRDREAVMDDDMGAFERAASLGKRDASAFTFEDVIGDENKISENNESVSSKPTLFDGLTNDDMEAFERAATLGKQDVSESGKLDQIELIDSTNGEQPGVSKQNELSSIYETIRANKAEKFGNGLRMEDNPPDERADFPFRIWHVDKKTGKETLVPPYTNPETMESLNYQDFSENGVRDDVNDVGKTLPDDLSSDTSNHNETKHNFADSTDENIYDGYTTIQESNGSGERQDELAAMRSARMKNRIEVSSVNEEQIGAQRLDDFFNDEEINSEIANPKADSSIRDLKSIYETIKKNKGEKLSDGLEMGENPPDERPDFPFRIWHVGKETGEKSLIPPYTNPETIEGLIYQDFSDSKDSDDVTNTESNSNFLTSRSNDVHQSNEEIYDGYTKILDTNGDNSRSKELDAMRKARMANRDGFATSLNEEDS